MVVFMEWNVMMWGTYLILMFCYDPVFLGPSHPVTIILGLVCLVGAILMFKKQLHITQWGRNIRFALATVIVFWTFVEICGRNGFFNEIWNDPMNHPLQMALILAAFVAVICTSIFFSRYISKEDV
jgi:Ca2+/Na+ antiporter